MIGAELTNVQVWVATAPIDLRKSFDSLAEAVRTFLKADPLSGSLFVFRNKGGHLLKILWWDRDGLAIYYKKLESDCPHFFLFTEIGRPANNLACRPAAAGGMDSVSTRNGPRRRPMPRQIAVIAPPRAEFSAGP